MWVSPSTVRRVLHEADLHFRPRPRPGKSKRRPFPAWADYTPNSIWIFDTTHFTRAGMAMLIIEDLISHKWITHVVSVEETSTQVEVAFTAALEAEGLMEAVDARQDNGPADLTVEEETRSILLAVSDNGAQMTSGTTREFMALCAIAQHFGRPGTPTDQAWIESLNGHLKGEYPHLLAIRDPATLRAELDVTRVHYNTVRLHQGVGYVTPDDEHEGRGQAIRQARRDGLKHARMRRLASHRANREDTTTPDPPMLSDPPQISIANSETPQTRVPGRRSVCLDGGRLSSLLRGELRGTRVPSPWIDRKIVLSRWHRARRRPHRSSSAASPPPRPVPSPACWTPGWARRPERWPASRRG